MTVKILLNHHADPCATSAGCHTALFYAHLNHENSNRIDIMELLIRAGANHEEIPKYRLRKSERERLDDVIANLDSDLKPAVEIYSNK